MKAKNIFIVLLVLLIVGLSIFFLYHKLNQIQEKKDVYSVIPTFQLPDIAGNIITELDLMQNKSVLFLFFNPDCELCREEFIQIKFNQESFGNFQMVCFSDCSSHTVTQFLQEIEFIPTSNMLFLIDDKEELIHKMDVKTSPTSYIYDKNGKLIKRFDGPVKIETLIKYLSEE